MPQKQPLGFIFYDGPSEIDGQRIIAIATGFNKKSRNAKTGNMIQTWILVADQKPSEAAFNGRDVSICGDCQYRYQPGIGRVCYVNVGQGPNSVWSAWRRGRYEPLTDLDVFQARLVRFGSYGDPAAVPREIWQNIAARCTGYTGYTHQWRTAHPDFSRLCMASADSDQDREDAKRLGYRVFRVRGANDLRRYAGEAQCPAAVESQATHKLQCSECMACSGTAGSRRGDIVISVHGIKPSLNAHRALTNETLGRGSMHA